VDKRFTVFSPERSATGRSADSHRCSALSKWAGGEDEIHPAAIGANGAPSLLQTDAPLLTLEGGRGVGVNPAGSIPAFHLIDLLMQPRPRAAQRFFRRADPSPSPAWPASVHLSTYCARIHFTGWRRWHWTAASSARRSSWCHVLKAEKN